MEFAAIAAFVAFAGGLVLLARHRGRRPVEAASRPDSLPVAHPTSDAGKLVARAESAVNRIRDLSRSPGDPWLRDHVADVDAQSTQALGSLRALAGRITVIEQTVARSDPSRLTAEAEQLAVAINDSNDNSIRAAHEESIAAVHEQQATLTRLTELRSTLIARMQPVVLGLEGVATRMGEVVALGSSDLGTDTAAIAVNELNHQLESLRTGLEQALGMAGDS